MSSIDVIPLDAAPTLAAAFAERARRSPDATAYIQFQEQSDSWQRYTWRQTARDTCRWRDALLKEQLAIGDRVAVMLRNCREWVMFDQAAQALGLVTVPLYTNDRPDNIGYILRDAGVRLLLVEDINTLLAAPDLQKQLAGLVRVISVTEPADSPLGAIAVQLEHWLTASAGSVMGDLQPVTENPDSLATIIYTSGTTGRPKGVMLSHANILQNAAGCLRMIDIFTDDLMLSFLPLSHTLERSLGYYLPILAGSQVAFSRSIPQLAEDMQQVKPTILISVPRIFERIYHRINGKLQQDKPTVRWLFRKTADTGWRNFEYHQRRAGWSPALLLWPLMEKLVAAKVQEKLGGRLRFAVSGGAPLAPEIARFFIGLGIRIQQGYGLTETSPVISANPLDDNLPDSVGCPLDGIELKIGENDELLTRSPSVMLGYWKNPEATRKVLGEDGWLHTGDQARIENGHLYITGRLKEIIVLANGEKVAPADMELALSMDKICDQVLVIGEGRPYLVALLVPNPEQFASLAGSLGMDPESEEVFTDQRIETSLLAMLQPRLASFPGYAQIRRLGIIREPWDIEHGLMTPTMKLRRERILDRYTGLVGQLYAGH